MVVGADWGHAYQGRHQTQFLGQLLARVGTRALIVGLEEVADKVARGTGVGGGAKGQQHEGHVES